MNETDLAWIAAELAVEVNRINYEQRMSIQTFRQALAHIPGGANMTMRYGQGGRTQIFSFDGEEVEVGPDATPADIEAALESKKKLQHSPTQ